MCLKKARPLHMFALLGIISGSAASWHLSPDGPHVKKHLVCLRFVHLRLIPSTAFSQRATILDFCSTIGLIGNDFEPVEHLAPQTILPQASKISGSTMSARLPSCSCRSWVGCRGRVFHSRWRLHTVALQRAQKSWNFCFRRPDFLF